MKKILGISIVAMLAVVPMMAQATPVAVTPAVAGGEPYQGVALDQDAHIATTSYVQGAYNAAIGAVNDLAGKKQDNLTNGTDAVGSTVLTEVRASGTADNTHLVTEGAVRAAIVNAGGQTANDVRGLIDTAAAGTTDGLTSSNGVLSVQAGNGITVTSDGVNVNYDGTTINKIATGDNAGKLEVVDGSITAAKIATGTITTTQVADGAMAKGAANDAVNDKLTTQGYVTESISAALANGTNAYQTASDVTSAINSAASETTDGLDASNGKLSVKYDNSTIDLNASGQLEVKEITASNVASAAKATGTANNDKLTTQGYVDDKVTTALANSGNAYQTASDVSGSITTALANGGNAYQTASDVSSTIGGKRVQVYTTWNSTAENTIQEVALVEATPAQQSGE